MDQIRISGLRVITLIGCLPHERELPQPIEIDLALDCDLHDCGRSDALSDTADYGKLTLEIAQLAQASRDRLLERLAARIAEVALRAPQVQAVTVCVKKLHAPIPHELRDVSVTIRRTAAELKSSQPLSRAIVALGTNLGDRLHHLRFALAELGDIVATSSIFETAPVGGPAQQGPFLNMVAIVQTALDPFAFLHKCQRIEAAAGRMRTEPWGPRTLDLDLLFYDDVVISSRELKVPHPRYAERGFVLAPLFEVAPERCPAGWQAQLEKSAVTRLDLTL